MIMLSEEFYITNANRIEVAVIEDIAVHRLADSLDIHNDVYGAKLKNYLFLTYREEEAKHLAGGVDDCTIFYSRLALIRTLGRLYEQLNLQTQLIQEENALLEDGVSLPGVDDITIQRIMEEFPNSRAD